MRRRRRWPLVTSLAVALLAVGLAIGVAIGAWWLPRADDKPAAAPTYTDQQVAEAKATVCTAFDKVARALDLSSARNGGDDPTAILGVATAGRQVLDFGSRYLLTKLNEQPATPADLADAIRKLANSYQEATIGYLDGLTNSDAALQPTLHASDQAAITINRLCK
ncbi:MAG: hypothetical protein ACRDTV_20210 [Mycobacterium sp.]